jgi:hypothetical protein
MRWRSGSANLNASIAGRATSALLLATVLGMAFWLWPDLDPSMLGATAPEHVLALFTAVFLAFWSYLVVQGYAVSHGDIGAASTHNMDNVISGLPAIPALFGMFRVMPVGSPSGPMWPILATMSAGQRRPANLKKRGPISQRGCAR